MKKNLFFGLCAASMLLMTSCDKEAFGGRFGEQETNVTLSVTLPELQTATRAYGTGVNAKYLQYAVYSLNAQGAINEEIKKVDNVEMTGAIPTTQISLKLVPGSKYSIVLWADAYGKDNTNSPFTVAMSTDANTMTVKTENHICKMAINDDMSDAFYGSFVITANPQENNNNGYTITEFDGTEIGGNLLMLKRPFAQLNIATANEDLVLAENSDFEITHTTVKISAVQNILDLRTGKLLGDGVETEYSLNEIPNDWKKDEYTTYTLLSMNYILMPKDKDVQNVTFYYSNGTTTKNKYYANVPLRRNWRTNIYGELFTNPVNITIQIAPAFANETSEDEEDKAANGDSDIHDTDNNDMYDANVDKDGNITFE